MPARVLMRADQSNPYKLQLHARAFTETVEWQIKTKLAEAMGPSGKECSA